jgi:hypothetical protein
VLTFGSAYFHAFELRCLLSRPHIFPHVPWHFRDPLHSRPYLIKSCGYLAIFGVIGLTKVTVRESRNLSADAKGSTISGHYLNFVLERSHKGFPLESLLLVTVNPLEGTRCGSCGSYSTPIVTQKLSRLAKYRCGPERKHRYYLSLFPNALWPEWLI